MGSAAEAGILPKPTQEKVISNSKKTGSAKTMSAGVNQFSGTAAAPGAKGPKGKVSEGSKKAGRGAAGATGKAFGVPSTKAKRPGK